MEQNKIAPERIFLKACHPASPNHNCTWSLNRDLKDSVEYVRADLNSVHPFGPCGYKYCDWPDGELRCNEPRANSTATNTGAALVEALLMARPIVDDIANARNIVTRKQDAEYVVKKIDAALAAAQETK